MERRNQVRPALRRDLQIVPQQHQGRRCFVVKDPVTLRYYRFQEPEHFILRHLDGNHTLTDVQRKFERHFRPQRRRLDEVEAFTREIVNSGLAASATTSASSDLLEHRQRRQGRERYAFWSNLLSIQFPLCDPDRFLGGILRKSRGLYSGTCFVLGLVLVLAALMLVATHLEEFGARLPGQRDFFTLQTIGYLWLALGLAKICHELGHGLACKAFGGEVHELGVMFLCFSPCLYCDVSDAWMVSGKWRRIFVSCAGIYVELVIAALATFVWWNAAAQPLLRICAEPHDRLQCCGTIVFNANPLRGYRFTTHRLAGAAELNGHAAGLFACTRVLFGVAFLGAAGWPRMDLPAIRWFVTAVDLDVFSISAARVEMVGVISARSVALDRAANSWPDRSNFGRRCE